MTEAILVTGATGFIGNYLIQLLLKKDNRVYALVRSKEQAKYLPPNVSVKVGDLSNPNSLMRACKDIDTIYHLAGYAHAANQKIPGFNDKHYEINFLGTKNLISAAEQANVAQFIFFSSTKAVADSSNCINETWEGKPNTPYGIAKRDAERLVQSFGEKEGRHTCILRPSLVYGPGCKGNLYSMIKAIEKGYFFPIPDIHNRRSMISLPDICQAAMLAARNNNANNKIYFVTDGMFYSTYQLYTSILLALGKSIPRWHVPLSVFKLMGYIGDMTEKILKIDLPINKEKVNKLFDSAQYDSTRIQNDLSFKPQYNFYNILPEMITAYRKKQSKEVV